MGGRVRSSLQQTRLRSAAQPAPRSPLARCSLPSLSCRCDGFLNMDRSNKFTPAQMAAIVAANQQLTSGQRR